MKKFRVRYIAVREFEVPDNATDEEYDAMKATVIAGMVGSGEVEEGRTICVELVDAPDEIKQKYIYNKDCD